MQTSDETPVAKQDTANCGVRMGFNFSVGAVAVILAAAIAYLVWRQFG